MGGKFQVGDKVIITGRRETRGYGFTLKEKDFIGKKATILALSPYRTYPTARIKIARFKMKPVWWFEGNLTLEATP